MDTSPFNTLSAELRNNIWELALRQPEPIKLELNKRNETVRKPPTKAIPHILALLSTCKKIHNETRDMPYFFNTFTIPSGYYDFSDKNFASAASRLRLFRWQIGRDIKLGNVIIEHNFGHEQQMYSEYPSIVLEKLFDVAKEELKMERVEDISFEFVLPFWGPDGFGLGPFNINVKQATAEMDRTIEELDKEYKIDFYEFGESWRDSLAYATDYMEWKRCGTGGTFDRGPRPELEYGEH